MSQPSPRWPSSHTSRHASTDAPNCAAASIAWMRARIATPPRHACASTLRATAVLHSIASVASRPASASRSRISIHSEMSKLLLPVSASRPRRPAAFDLCGTFARAVGVRHPRRVADHEDRLGQEREALRPRRVEEALVQRRHAAPPDRAHVAGVEVGGEHGRAGERLDRGEQQVSDAARRLDDRARPDRERAAHLCRERRRRLEVPELAQVSAQRRPS